MSASPEPAESRTSVRLHNLRVILFNWLPALGCLAAGVTGVVTGMDQATKASLGGALYLLAGAVGFGLFVWISRQPSD